MDVSRCYGKYASDASRCDDCEYRVSCQLYTVTEPSMHRKKLDMARNSTVCHGCWNDVRHEFVGKTLPDELGELYGLTKDYLKSQIEVK